MSLEPKFITHRQPQRVSRHQRLRLECLEPRRVLAAMIQVIHDSPFDAAKLVDVYANDELLIDDFAFQDATPYVEVPANVDIKIDITAADAADNSAPVFSTSVNLQDATSYVAIATGDPLNRPENPAFTLNISDLGRTSASDPNAVEVLAFHGAINTPPVDIVAVGEGVLVNDLAYSQFSSDYVSVAPNLYTVNVTHASDNSTVFASYFADHRGDQGDALVVVASGFFHPADERPDFSLFAVYPDGSTATLPSSEFARVQLVHNSPYAAAGAVDVYANDMLLLDDFAFRDASPFIDVPANLDVKLDITAADAADNSAPVYTTTVNLPVSTYVVIAGGDPLGTEGQPAFGLAVTDMGQEAAANPSNAEALVFHGSPDAPPVDVYARGGGKLVDDLAYSEFGDGYVSVPPGSYTLDITAADYNAVVIASFEADLSSLAGGAAVIAASGFMTPATDTDPGFGLLAIFPDGTTALLPAGTPAPVPGDSNGDGQFDHEDLVQVMTAGKYETGEAATFEEGDWNRDGVFDSSDFICVFQLGTYVVDEAPAAVSVQAVDALFAG